MENKPSKAYRRFKFIFIILFIMFMCLYFAGITGYYDKNIATNTLLTKEAIIAFENDVKQGKAVDITDYIKANPNNYKNIYSNIGYTISDSIDHLLNDGVKWVIGLLKSLFS
jgi:hypothetical protein